MPEDPKDDDWLEIEKRITAKFLRVAGRHIREAPTREAAEAYMRAAGRQLQVLAGPPDRSTRAPAGRAPEVQPPQLAELMKRRRRVT